MLAATPLDLVPPRDARTFRDALGSFATGVTIVTTRTTGGRACGVTVNSFTSLSLDPPLVLWSLALSSSSYPAFDEATHFVVHVLAEGQEHIARQFARSGVDRFANLDLQESVQGIPMLPGVVARFQCRTHCRYWGGDHAIFVGEVDGFTHAPERKPLVFHKGAMRGGL